MTFIGFERPLTFPSRLAFCAVVSGLLCPLVFAMCLGMGAYFWEWTYALSSLATVALYANIEGISLRPGEMHETLGMVLSTAIASLAPSLAVGLFSRGLAGRLISTAAFYPAWFGVLLAPAAVVYAMARHIDAALPGSHLFSNFLVLFSALAASLAASYGLWVRLAPRPAGVCR